MCHVTVCGPLPDARVFPLRLLKQEVTFAFCVNVGTGLLICEDKGSFFLGGGGDQRSSGDIFKNYLDILLKSSGLIPDDLMGRPSKGSAANITCTILR